MVTVISDQADQGIPDDCRSKYVIGTEIIIVE